MNVTHVIVHTPEQVRQIITEARMISKEIGENWADESEIFGKACDLLGQRQTIVTQDAPVAVDLSKLRATG